MRIRITFQSVVSRSPMIIIGLLCLTSIWVGVFLYTRLYKPITQAESITILRSESALQNLDYQAYEHLKENQQNRRNLKQIEAPASFNPFIQPFREPVPAKSPL